MMDPDSVTEMDSDLAMAMVTEGEKEIGRAHV
jgi:hypothetical protein